MFPGFTTTWASISKVLTAVGVLKALQATGHSIDDHVSPFLPNGWTIKHDPNFARLTFGDLLAEQGFAKDSCADEHYYGLKALVEENSVPSSPTTAYNNCNFALLRIILPVLVYGGLFFNEPSAENTLALGYVTLMQQYVFAPLGIDQASCGSDVPDPSRRILSYPFPPELRSWLRVGT